MKKLALLSLLFLASVTQADTPPIKNIYQMKAPGGNAVPVGLNGSVVPVGPGCTSGYVLTYTAGAWTCAAAASGGVTSVALALPTSVFDISGSPVTSSGTLTATFDTQAANQCFMGPVGGGPATPSFRSLVAADIPTGNLTAAGTDGISITGGTSAVVGSGTSLSQHVADTSNNGYLSSSDWNVFNGKQDAGNYITALTGDVSASGPGSAGATIQSGVVSNSKLATMAAHTFKGNNTGSTAAPSDLTATQLTAELNAFTSLLQGLVPASGGGTSNFLRADGSWSPAGSGTVTSVSVASANGFAGSVANATTTPAITLSTSITGLLKGNGTAISAATAGTDYSAGTSALATGILKSTTSTGGLSIAVAGDFPTLNQNTSGNAATVTTNANLTGPITSVGNATSIAAQTGTGTTFVVDTSPTLVTPTIGVATATSLKSVAVAGSNVAGNNLPLLGGTSTGTGIGGAVTFSVAPAGSTGSGVNAVAEVARFGASGLTVGNTTAQTARLYAKQTTTGDTGIVLENGNNTRKFVIDGSNANNFFMGLSGTNYQMGFSNVASGGSGAGWMSFGANGIANPPAWPFAFETVSADGNVTSLTATAFTSLAGASVNGAPIIVQRNRNSTANTLAEWGNTGSSGNLMGGWGTRHVVQTASSEQSDLYGFNRNSGTMQEVFRFNQNGNLSITGSAPQTPTSCGTSPAIAGNNDVFKLTVGTGGTANACVVPFAATPAWDNAPSCNCVDETTSIFLRLVPTTSQLTINGVSLTTGTAQAFGASDVIRCTCMGYR